jgi:hypothetical protein
VAAVFVIDATSGKTQVAGFNLVLCCSQPVHVPLVVKKVHQPSSAEFNVSATRNGCVPAAFSLGEVNTKEAFAGYQAAELFQHVSICDKQPPHLRTAQRRRQDPLRGCTKSLKRSVLHAPYDDFRSLAALIIF